MTTYKKILMLLFYPLCSIPVTGACAEKSDLAQYLDQNYIHKAHNETNKTLLSIKDLLLSDSALDIHYAKASQLKSELEILEEKFTKIAAAKLRLEPNNATAECNFFQLSAQAGDISVSLEKVMGCITSSCGEREQKAILETLFLKLNELDNENMACLRLMPKQKTSDTTPLLRHQ